MAPEDRVRADPALAVIDERALVVGSQEDHPAVEIQERGVAEALDLAVRYSFPIADDPPNVMLGRKHLCHATKYRPRRRGARHVRPRTGRRRRRRDPLRRPEAAWEVALDLQLVHVVQVQRAGRGDLPAPGERPRREPRELPRRYGPRGDHVEAELEARVRRGMHGHRPRVGVRVAVGDQHERDAIPAEHGHRRLEPQAAADQDARQRADEGDVPRPAPVSPAELVHPANELRVEPDAGAERETAPVDAPQGDQPFAPGAGQQPGARNRVTREPERAGQDTRPTPRDKADEDAPVEPVHDLVVEAVAAEGVEPLVLVHGRGGEVGSVARALREQRVDLLPGGGQLALHRDRQLRRDPRRLRVDDQRARHGRTVDGETGEGAAACGPLSCRFGLGFS